MTERILLVDDDPNILQGYQRVFRKRFTLEPALCGTEGLEAVINQGPYAIVVADMRMPGMNGVEFLAKVKEIAPDTIRIMLTGNADQQTALDAVNEGHIFRFLTKPCDSELFAKTLDAGLSQYRLIAAERELIAKTLRGSIQVLTDILGLVNPAAFARASRVKRMVIQLCEELHVERSWIKEIAAMLSQIGCMAIPEEILRKVDENVPLTNHERNIYNNHPMIASSLLAHIPRMEEIADIIAHQNDSYELELYNSNSSTPSKIPYGSRILKVALDWDILVSGGMSTNLALAEMNDKKTLYDPTVLTALHHVLHISARHVIRQVKVNELIDGAILADDISSLKGTLLCSKGQEVSPSMRARLKNYIANVGIQGLVKIYIPIEVADKMMSMVPNADEEDEMGRSHTK